MCIFVVGCVWVLWVRVPRAEDEPVVAWRGFVDGAEKAVALGSSGWPPADTYVGGGFGTCSSSRAPASPIVCIRKHNLQDPSNKRKHNLQDPSNKRKIICDDALRLVFETDCTDMFKMNKLLSKHKFSLQATNESAPAKRSKVDVEDASQGTESVSSSTAVISEEHATFLGSTRREMDQREAKNRVWDYIKAKGLEVYDKINLCIACS
ncbi:hypothetical protein Dimus_004058 [Dionaea muscipula]